MFVAQDGPTHDYIQSSPACWAAYGEVLAREYADRSLFRRVHRHTVDTNALQHPGDFTDRRSVQSVWLHLVSLHLLFVRGWPPERATKIMATLSGRVFEPPSTRPGRFEMTVQDVAAAEDRHAEVVLEWAHSTYDVWTRVLPEASVQIARAIGQP